MKAFALLHAFRDSDEYLTSAQLSRRAGLPEASGYRLVQTLEAVGALARDDRGLYRPSFLLAEASKLVLLAEALRETSRELLKSAAERFGATIHVGILEHSMVTYVAKVSARDSVPVPTRCGAQQEPYCSGIGKVLLAGLSDGELECFLGEGELIPLTEQTITDPALFRQEIQRIRRNGFAIDAGEGHPHLSCVAVPVRNPQGETIAALSLMDRRAAMDEQRQDDVRWALSTAAETISRKLRAASSMQTANRVASWRPSPSFTDRLGLASQAQRRRLTA